MQCCKRLNGWCENLCFRSQHDFFMFPVQAMRSPTFVSLLFFSSFSAGFSICIKKCSWINCRAQSHWPHLLELQESEKKRQKCSKPKRRNVIGRPALKISRWRWSVLAVAPKGFKRRKLTFRSHKVQSLKPPRDALLCCRMQTASA